ncbi:MAG: BMC domain-containing protein [Clostridia bacterium]|nr:BMC domain-containing protein [Clostridia bacterium]
MQALGLIETWGLLPAIECADVMLKTAPVELLERTFVGGGYVTITITGDVAAVKAAVEAGVSAVERISQSLLKSCHVIPRPHSEVEGTVILVKATSPQKKPSNSAISVPLHLELYNKKEVDAFFQDFGFEQSVNALKMLSVEKLRRLARDYKELDIAGRAISRANKELLIQQIAEYYRKEFNK